MSTIHNLKTAAPFIAVTFVVAVAIGIFPEATMAIMAIAGWSATGEVIRLRSIRNNHTTKAIPSSQFHPPWLLLGAITMFVGGAIGSLAGLDVLWLAVGASVCAASLVFFCLSE